MQSLSHPSLGWLNVFSSFPPRLPPPPRPPPQRLLHLTSKLFEQHLTYLAQRIYRCGKIYWMTFPWPWSKVTAVASISKKLLVCMIKLEPLIHYKILFLYCHSHGHYLIRFWSNSIINWYFSNFLLKIRIYFFKLKHYFVHISGMVGPIDVKKGSASVWYWV